MKLFAVFLASVLACNSSAILATTITNTTNETTIAIEQEIALTGAYMLNGFLFIKSKDLPDKVEVHQLLDAQGQKTNNTLSDVRKVNDANQNGYIEYALYRDSDKIRFDDGKYELILNDIAYPIISIANYRQDSGLRTVNNDPTLNDKEIPFCDYVYPVIFNNDAYDSISFEIFGTETSLNPDKWPQILKDGMKEGTIQISYPKDANTNEPKTYTDFPKANEKAYSLDHQDKLILKIDDTIVDSYYWDQISKVWYQEKTVSDTVEMVHVEGGTYMRGDWDGLRSNYAFDNDAKRRVNVKKLWLNVKDPQYMNESAIGEDAVGVSGLQDSNSLTKDEDSDMWIYNADAIDQHQVRLSDFMIGKYEITMNQYYAFVNATEGEAPNCTYTIDDKTYTINEIASYAIYDKRQTVRDNGWGEGSRPVIDINWYEAIEFCNYLSRMEGLEPCYTFTNIYNGEVGDGLTTVSFLGNVAGSAMQKERIVDKAIQLVKVDCDFKKNGYRLPTESEFEYVARGGKYISQINNGNGYVTSGVSKYDTQNTETNADYFAWYRDTVDNPQIIGSPSGNVYSDSMGGNGYSNPVGSKLPNCLGIYDLTGNVWEHCWDYYNATYYTTLKNTGGVHQDPTGPNYTIAEISVLDDYPVDSSMANEYKYTYVADEQGLYTRTEAKSLLYSGKLMHTLRGGCFTNPIDFAITINRYAPGQIYVDNVINFTDARIGFRVARSVTESTLNREV